MKNRLTQNISFGAIALLALLLSTGIALIRRINDNQHALEILPSPHNKLTPLPPGAERTISPPHEPRGAQCHACHPLLLTDRGTLSGPGGPFGPSRTGNAAPGDWTFRTPAWRGTQYPQGGPFFAQGRQAAMPLAAPALESGGAGAQIAQGQGSPSQVAAGAARPAATSQILTPSQQNASAKIPVEGHWLGMETIDLTAALRRIYQIPAAVSGVMVDEVTLESAESGILAGDVITRVQGRRTPDLRAFFEATLPLAQKKTAEITVYRQGDEKRFVLEAKNTPSLGFAAMEAAQPIRPGALSPHRQRNRACTTCHVIMATGGQLPIDAGDVLPSPPPISPNARAPHAYRGACNSCHVIKR